MQSVNILTYNANRAKCGTIVASHATVYDKKTLGCEKKATFRFNRAKRKASGMKGMRNLDWQLRISKMPRMPFRRSLYK